MIGNDGHDRVESPSPGETRYEIIQRMLRNTSLDLRVAAPAQVVTYNPTTQKADLLLGFLPVRPGPVGVEVPDPPVTLPGVPVLWPRSTAGYLTFPLIAGDTGLVVFTDRAIGEWTRLGGTVDPSSGRAHSLADGVFLPGLHPDTAPITPATDLTAAVLEGTLVKVGRLAAEFGLKGTTLAATSATLFGTLTAIPAATDPATSAALANANKAAILGLLDAIQDAVSTKVQIE